MAMKSTGAKELTFLRQPSYWLKLIALFAIYFLTAKFGLSLDAVSGFATLIWAPTGIAIAALLLFGFRMTPAIALAAFLINLSTGAPLVAALGIAVGNSLEAVVGVFFLKVFGFNTEFKRARDTYLYVLVAALFATTIAATIGTTVLALTGAVHRGAYDATWIAWWEGDLLGALIVGYFLLNLAKSMTLRGVRLAEAIVMFVIFFLANAAYFFDVSWAHPIIQASTLNLAIVILLFYATIRFGSLGAAWALFTVLAIGVAGTIAGEGPYKGMTLFAGLEKLQSGLGWVGAFILLLAGISDERTTSRMEAGKANEELKEKSLVLEEAEKLSGIGSCRWDIVENKIVISDQLCRLFDITREEFKGTFPEVLEHFHEENRKEIGEKVSAALATHQPFEFETRVTKRKTGIMRDIRVSCRPLLGPDGRPISVVAAVRDITDEKESERQKAREVALLESIGDGVVGVDAEKNIIYVNRAAQDMLGMEADEMIGKNYFTTVRAVEEDGKLVPDAERLLMLGTRLQKSLSKRAHYYVRKDGTRFPTAVSVSPVISGGKIFGVVTSFRDITSEIELDRAKDELISLASHQLRTPPTGIMWFTGMLLNEEVGKINDDQRKYLKEILYNNQRMIDIVDAMLNSSRLEMGTFVSEPKPVNFIDIVESVFTDLSAEINEKGLVITKDYAKDLPVLSLDPILMRMIAQNLIVNAVKYSAHGGAIRVSVQLTDAELLFSVRDNGLGIPKDAQPRIFTKLFRAGNTRSSDSSGSGLGLYIVKRILNKLGGDISFESEEHKGTEFSVRIPVPSHLDNVAG